MKRRMHGHAIASPARRGNGFRCLQPENRSWGAHPPRVSLDAPRVQPFGAGPPPKRLELFGALGVFREGAENQTRGACDPHLNFGVRVKSTRGQDAPIARTTADRLTHPLVAPVSQASAAAIAPDDSEASFRS